MTKYILLVMVSPRGSMILRLTKGLKKTSLFGGTFPRSIWIVWARRWSTSSTFASLSSAREDRLMK